MSDVTKPKVVAIPERQKAKIEEPTAIPATAKALEPADLQKAKLARSDQAARPKNKRRRAIKISYALCVAIPTLLGIIYYAAIASDRYVASAGFAVRGMDAAIGADLLGAMTGLASTGSTTSDSYILLNYLKSRDIVERLDKEIQIRQKFSAENIDFLSRLDPAIDIERFVDYWEERIHTTYDSTSGIVTFDVEGFTPNEALEAATLVLEYSRGLVNDLSVRARHDAVSYAESEVQRSETRLRAALDQLRDFRETEKALDPAGAARIQMELIGGLERQLAEVRARIAALGPTVNSDSPSYRTLKRQADALQNQIEAQREDSSTGERTGQAALTGQLAVFETLEVERNFAQQLYASSLSSLEKARVEADRQQRYLAVYTAPALPQYPLYPRRLLNIFLIFAGLSVIWAIGTLITYAVRDHIS